MYGAVEVLCKVLDSITGDLGIEIPVPRKHLEESTFRIRSIVSDANLSFPPPSQKRPMSDASLQAKENWKNSTGSCLGRSK